LIIDQRNGEKDETAGSSLASGEELGEAVAVRSPRLATRERWCEF